MKKIDLMCLEAVSKAKISIDTTNNPDGAVYDEIDLLLPDDHKDTVGTTWDNDSTAKPIDDIHDVIRTMQAEGIVFDKMLMSMPVFWAYQATDQVKEYLYGVDYKGVPTLEQLNRYLTENKMPVTVILKRMVKYLQ